MTTFVNGQTIEERIYRLLCVRPHSLAELRMWSGMAARHCDLGLYRLRNRHQLVESDGNGNWRALDASVAFPRPDYSASGRAGAAARWKRAA